MAGRLFSNSDDTFPADVPWERVERFIGQFIHDVRNGLNALELQLTFLGEISTDPEAIDEVKRLRATLQNVTKHLQSVKLAASAVAPHAMDYPATDLFEDLRERLERQHPEASEKVSWDIVTGPEITLLLDPDLTINGLLELFDNAFAFGASDLLCTTAETPGGLSFILQEMPAAGSVVTMEYWGEPLLTTRRSAYGLGLFRLRRILAAQGGSIAFDVSVSPDGQRLTTTVTLRQTP